MVDHSTSIDDCCGRAVDTELAVVLVLLLLGVSDRSVEEVPWRLGVREGGETHDVGSSSWDVVSGVPDLSLSKSSGPRNSPTGMEALANSRIRPT